MLAPEGDNRGGKGGWSKERVQEGEDKKGQKKEEYQRKWGKMAEEKKSPGKLRTRRRLWGKKERLTRGQDKNWTSRPRREEVKGKRESLGRKKKKREKNQRRKSG